MKKTFRCFIWVEVLALAVLILHLAGSHMEEETVRVAGREQGSRNETKTELTDGKKVALTFDDGPNKCFTEELLDGLAMRNVKATFFLIGKKVDENPEIVKRMYEEGHLIGNHTYDHVNLSALSEESAREQLDKTNDAIKRITGKVPEYLRPPFGNYKKHLDEEMTMIEVLWDVDPRDWSVKNAGEVVKRVVKKVEDEDIILLHDDYATSVVAALEIIDILQEQGYEFVTVEELLLD